MKFTHSVIIAFLLALAWSTPSIAGDVAKGKKVFKKCAACHSNVKDGPNKIGPNLWGIVGTKAGKKEGFKYSKALMKSDLTWDDATLDVWLKSPKKVVKKTKMLFVGLRKQKQRDDVIAYLKTLK